MPGDKICHARHRKNHIRPSWLGSSAVLPSVKLSRKAAEFAPLNHADRADSRKVRRGQRAPLRRLQDTPHLDLAGAFLDLRKIVVHLHLEPYCRTVPERFG